LDRHPVQRRLQRQRARPHDVFGRSDLRWHEIWFILGGAGLFCVFSVAYTILMPALYIPMLIMLIALIFRSIAFEFRFKADASRRIRD